MEMGISKRNVHHLLELPSNMTASLHNPRAAASLILVTLNVGKYCSIDSGNINAGKCCIIDSGNIKRR
jgi:hypothetical protein